MKHLLFGLLALLSSFGLVSATTVDNQIFDELENDQLSADDLQFNTFQSCDEMNSVLTTYIKDNFNNQQYNRGFPQPMPMIMDEMLMMEATSADLAEISVPQFLPATAGGAVTTTTSTTANLVSKVSNSSTNDFSTTNTQVKGIDEADILKSDGDHLYYYNQKEQKVQIIKTPLNIASKTIDLDRLDIVTEINLPDNFSGIQMYRQADNLVILANRWRNSYNGGFLNNGNQVDAIVYDVSNSAKPALIRFTELDGNYHDSRLIGDKLYIINQLNIDRYRPMRNGGAIEDIDLTDIPLAPKNIDIAYTKNDSKKNLELGDTTFPYHISVNEADCNNIYYVLPSKESANQFGLHPSFTTVNIIDLASTETIPEITTAFGNTNTIHMAKDNVYLTQNFWVPGESRGCPANARCIMPSFNGGAHTLIHKFNIKDEGVIYQDSTLANGSPLTQYSMDQGPEGNFRILTSTRSPERATHLYILDDDLETVGSVENIEPGEEFKSSRYIGDKLYLVTFEQTDPLFVIDMVKPTDPKIIGELVIPGFSTYLHPYGPVQNNVQYLIGLGWDTDLNEWGGTVQEGIKVDLYKIDYNTKVSSGHSNDEYCSEFTFNDCPSECTPRCVSGSCSGDTCASVCSNVPGSCTAGDSADSSKEYVSVTQEFSETRGMQGSQSEAIYNPRMFVRDESKKLLVLPMQLTEDQAGNEICESEKDPDGNIIRQECRVDEQNQTTFVGMKAIQIDPSRGITETASFDYTHLYKQDPELYNNGRFNTYNLTPRVGYVGDVLYQVNGAFGHFINTASGAEQAFLPLGKTPIDFEPKPIGVVASPFEVTPMDVSLCLNNAGFTLYEADDCRYCEPQKEVFGEYYEKLNKINCTQEQALCSDAGITGYPTRVVDETAYPGVKDLEALATLAGCK